MNNRMITDDELTRLFEKDATGIVPNTSVRERLEYTFMVKSSTYKTAQNSFMGMFSWIFSWSNIPLKAALVSFVLFISIMNFQPRNSQFLTPGCDTTQNNSPIRIDSAGMLPFFADTCLNAKS
ncbi:MAG: hypothetical protein ABFS16_03555 [Bacteroidota bacterium]